MRMQKQFLIKVNYKSGITETTWYSKFKIGEGSYECTVVDILNNRPLALGSFDDIESVWIVKNRTRLVWK